LVSLVLVFFSFFSEYAMKLSYRGVRYLPTSTEVTTGRGQALGQYRGSVWHATEVVSPLPVPAAHLLKYRGVAYSTQPDLLPVPVAAPAVVAASAVVQAPRALPALSIAAHRDAILRNLERRLISAQAKGDDRLVHLLEDELRHFA
jgi:hypothetical protein